jgi:hypothetical protein
MCCWHHTPPHTALGAARRCGSKHHELYVEVADSLSGCVLQLEFGRLGLEIQVSSHDVSLSNCAESMARTMLMRMV